MYSKLFHKDVWFPENTNSICRDLQKMLTTYFLSNHFEEHLKNQENENRSHTYLREVVDKCLKSLKNNQQDVFEVELSKDYHYFGAPGWFVTKYCCRIPYDANQDLVVAIRPQYRGTSITDNMVVTAWMNSHSDNHSTLDPTKYSTIL